MCVPANVQSLANINHKQHSYTLLVLGETQWLPWCLIDPTSAQPKKKKMKKTPAGSWLRLAGPGKLKQTVVLEARKGEEGAHRSGCHRGKALLGPLSLAHASPPALGVPPECWSWVGVEAPTGE